jgi:threonylcarbamoyladenosine tRNA methylthiotransferase MtaB
MKVFLDMVGCRLNQAEIERMAGQFRSQGHAIVPEAGEADLVIVNTCTVTSQAASDSRQKIRQAARAGAKDVVVTGCWSTLQPAQAADLPGVIRVVPNDRKDHLVPELLHLPEHDFDVEPLARTPLPGLRQRTRAFIKAQDGCDNHCTFCITTLARGESVSRASVDVLTDIRAALLGGVQEIVLTGVHLGAWGLDIESRLSTLIRRILDETDTPRLRLSSLEPWDLDEEFFTLWEDSRLCPHLHLPIQSGSASTLKRMLRKTTPESFRELVASARKMIPDVAVTTDVMTGFPGETDAEFNETLDFIHEIEFAGGHVFTYSARPGTPAARMKHQVPHAIRKQRNHVLREVFSKEATRYRQKIIGRTLPVLWESVTQVSDSGWQLEGWSGNYIRVTANAPEPCWNQINNVKLIKTTMDGMTGEIMEIP